jgi:hypothetical protein
MNLLIKSFLVFIVIFLTIFLIVWTMDMDGGLINDFVVNNENHKNDDSSGRDHISEQKIFIVDGYKAIQINEEIIVASGLEFGQLEAMSFKPEFIAYAEVINIEPLVSLKTEYQAILSEQKILQYDLYNHNKILKRAEALHKAKSLSTRDLEKNRADRDLKASQLNAMNTRLTNYEYKVKSLWGDALASFILDQEKQTYFDELASYNKLLILLSLSKNQTLANQQQKVFVSNINQRETALTVSYLDQAKHVNNPLYGESYIYLLDSQKLRAGMRLFAWIEESSNSVEGLFVPESAVIWYANAPWIYLKHGEDLFVRKPLGNARKVNKGWLLEDESLIVNDLVVTRGGQTLLSEEFKWAIPDEDDD